MHYSTCLEEILTDCQADHAPKPFLKLFGAKHCQPAYAYFPQSTQQEVALRRRSLTCIASHVPAFTHQWLALLVSKQRCSASSRRVLCARYAHAGWQCLPKRIFKKGLDHGLPGNLSVCSEDKYYNALHNEWKNSLKGDRQESGGQCQVSTLWGVCKNAYPM